ncbi:MAG TPA: hypothetical protein VHN79_14135, partial [Lacunisphaera sp.]|nr:hypothetical protein [Lacunisphaera sp.]
LGLAMPASANDEPAYAEIDDAVWWLNLDSRGGLWINGREKKPGEVIAPATVPMGGEVPTPAGTEPADAAAAPVFTPSARVTETKPETRAPAGESGAGNPVLAGVRLLLKETKTGAIAGKVERLAEELGKPAEEFLATLTGAGLKVPEKSREKPVFVEHAGEIFWLNMNTKGELWLNAKASKFTDKKDDGAASDEAGADGEKKSARRGGGRSRKKSE